MDCPLCESGSLCEVHDSDIIAKYYSDRHDRRQGELHGPLTPTPQLTLEEAVLKAVNAEERWYAMNDGWVD